MDFLKYLRYDESQGKLFWKEKPYISFPNKLLGQEAGTDDGEGYIVFQLLGVRYRTHRVIWFLHNGTWPEMVDHKDNDPSNNRIGNLRDASNRQNQQNRKGSSELPKGVSVCKQTGLYRADICVDGLHKNLGRHAEVETAAQAYQDQASKAFGEFARFA